MKALPIGVPKVMVSTVASGNIRPYIGNRDIAMMFSVADMLGGVNVVTKTILSNATGAVLGMCEVNVKMQTAINKKVIGITAFGSTNGAASRSLELLRNKGYEVVVFHASGAGGSAMEDPLTKELFQAFWILRLTNWWPNCSLKHVTSTLPLEQAGSRSLG